MELIIFLSVIAFFTVYCAFIYGFVRRAEGIYLGKLLTDSKLRRYMKTNKEIFVSRAIVGNVKTRPAYYLKKYFFVENTSEELTELMNQVLAAAIAYGRAKELEQAYRDKCIKESLIFRFPLAKLFRKNWDINKIYYNTYVYSFCYVSPQGRNKLTVKVRLDSKILKQLIPQAKNTVKAERNKMTAKLREQIKIRDNYTCQICGNSTYKEPNLLLEIDHIIPVSKGGKTTPENLQTLCWKCNRSKSNKSQD